MDSSVGKETSKNKDDDTRDASNNKKLAAAQLATAAGIVKETAAAATTSTKTGTSKVAAANIEPSSKDDVVALLAAPSIDDEFDDVNASTEQQLVSQPGAVHVRGIGANARTDSLAVSFQGEDVDHGLVLTQQQLQQQEPFVMVDVVSEEDIRREYLPDESHNNEYYSREPVKAEPLPDRKRHRHRVWIALAIIAAVTIVLAAILVPVLVVFLPNHHPGNNPNTVAVTPPPQPQTMCSITTNFLIGNNTNLTALLLNQSAVTPTWENLGNGQTYGTYDASSDATQAKTLCSRLGGKFVEEDFTVMCNSSAQNNNNDNGTLVAQFKRNFVCVGKTCNTSEVESYLQALIDSRTQSLEKEANKNCEAVYGTYTYQDSSTQEQQVQYYLPSIWGEQCALEYDVVTNNINNFTTSHNTAAIPSCQRNGTTNDAVCTVDFTYDATQITEPFCASIQGSRSLQLDFTFQCASQSGAIYVIEHLHQPVCTGVSCDLSRVKHFTTDLFRSSLADQGYHNCQLLSSDWYNASNHTIMQELNVSALVLDGDCHTATAFLSGNLTLAAFYSDAITAAIHPTNNFVSQASDAGNLCYEYQGSQYVDEEFTIVCDFLTQNGTSSVYYDFLHVFYCFGGTCDASEVESYLEWPLVFYTHRLESGGHVQNCQVRYGSYVSYAGDGQTDYLPSIWGDKCVAETKLIFSNTNLTTLQDNTVTRQTCEQHGSQAIKCTTDYIGYNTQLELACLSIGGLYFEVDFAFTCGYQVGSNVAFTIEYLRYPQCTGRSCNVNQSSAESVETIKALLTDGYGLQDCQLVLQDGPYQNASTLQQRNVSGGDDGECALATNIISTNSQWAAFNRLSFDDKSCSTKGNAKNCTYDQSPFASQGNSTCTSAGGHLVGFNYTLGNCDSGDGFIYTYNYINDLYCLGLSCNANQMRNYRTGEIAKRYIENNCSEGLFLIT